MKLDNESPVASVLIPFFKADQWLPEQLDALAAQIGAPTFEVVIADNEGSDTLASLVEPFLPRLDVKIVEAGSRPGPAHARNAAAAAARGHVLLMCDADDRVSPEWVGALSSTLLEQDVLATGPLRVHTINGETAWRTYASGGTDVHGQEPVLTRPFEYLGYLPIVIGCNVGLRRSSFEQVTGFDESMLAGAEDADLAWRCQESGISVLCVEQALVDYRLREDARQIFRQRRAYERGKMRLWVRSRRLGRPVRGMSLRWALVETLKLGPRWLRLRNASPEERYVAAFQSGGIVGNLESQITMRLLKLDV